MKRCPYCGFENADSRKWCQHCLKLLQDIPAAESACVHEVVETAEKKSRLRGNMGKSINRKPDESRKAGAADKSCVSSFAHSGTDDAVPRSKRSKLTGSVGDRKYIKEEIAERREAVLYTANGNSKKKGKNECRYCGEPVDNSQQYCMCCGKQIRSVENDRANVSKSKSRNACKYCGAHLGNNLHLCPTCGRRVETAIDRGSKSPRQLRWRLAGIVFSVILLAAAVTAVLWREDSNESASVNFTQAYSEAFTTLNIPNDIAEIMNGQSDETEDNKVKAGVNAALSQYIVGNKESNEETHSFSGTLQFNYSATFRSISENASYEVMEIQIDGDYAYAVISIESPDVLAIMQEILDNHAISSSDELLSLLDSALKESILKKQYSVRVALEKVNDEWVLVENFNLLNALYGGILEEGKQVIEDVTADISGGTSND